MQISIMRPLLHDAYDASEFYKLIRVNRIGTDRYHTDHHLSHLKWVNDATYESTLVYLRDVADNKREDFFFIFVDGKIAGAITLRELTVPTSYEQMIGYWVGKEYTNSGVATEAVRQILARAKYGKVVAQIRSANLASDRVLTKNGFKEEGTLNQEGWRQLVWRK